LILDGAKEHYILDIEHSDKANEIIETLWPAIPYQWSTMLNVRQWCVDSQDVIRQNCEGGKIIYSPSNL